MTTANNAIICKSVLSDSFLLYLIKEGGKPENVNVRSYEYEYLENNKKFKLTKHVAVELYLGLQRLINRNKIEKWRKANNIKRKNGHNKYRELIAKQIYELLIKICVIDENWNDNDIDIDINKMYDDIGNIHFQSLLQNTKTRMSFLKENYILGKYDNISFHALETQNNFKYFQQISQRNGLSNNRNVFRNFKFSLDLQLLLKQKREKCAYCGKKSYLYCPYCKVPFLMTDSKNSSKYIKLPNLKLPINIDIIRHPQEMVNVCSSVHGCIMAPNNIKMYQFPNMPPILTDIDLKEMENESVCLLYPSEKAVFLDEILIEKSKIKRIIVIESRWRGNKQIYQHKQLKHLRHVKIRNRETLYWRYQELSKEYLATIEAIYYVLKDCCSSHQALQYQLDDLLMLFACQHQKIRNNNHQHTKSFWDN